MTIDIESMIEQRPHLKDPLEFYARWQRFQRDASELLPKHGSALSPEDSQVLPRDSARDVLRLFASVFDLPGEELASLGRALEAGDIDFMRLPLDEVPDLSLPYGENELVSILFLMSRPYFLALRESYPLDGRQWENGHCPLCSARSTLASIAEGPKRNLHCSYCGTVGSYSFTGCPNCGTGDASKLGTLVSEEEPGFRVTTCEECRTYVKVVEGSVLNDMTVDLMDMASLPLDIVAQEKGYVRRAPNPIGLKKMV
jgi:FdhE protein